MNRTRLAIALMILPGLASAQSWDQHLVTGTTDARLPSGVGLTDTVLAFGQPRFDPYGNPLIEDIVRVFELQGGEFVEVDALQSTLVPATSASFGVAVDVEGDLLAIGDPAAIGAGFTSGAVHLYRRGANGWAVEEVLQPAISVGSSVLQFGVSLDIDNGRLAIAAPTSTVHPQGLEDGAVYIFERIGGVWTEVQHLLPSPTAPFGHFGRDIELDGDRLIIGHPGGDPALGVGGLAYIYDHNGTDFLMSGVIASTSPDQSSGFGMNVAVSGGLAAVASPGVSIANFGDGMVSVFEENAGVWNQTANLTDVNLRPYNRFGGDLEFEGGELFISSENTASVQRFQNGQGGWTSVERYTTAAGFTYAPVVPVRVRSVNGRVVVTDVEGATVFQRDVPATLEVNCLGTPYPNPVPGVPASPVIMDMRSELSFSEGQIDFLIMHPAGMGPGVLFYGFNTASLPFAGGSTLCVAPPVKRAGLGQASATYFTELSLDLQTPPVSSGAFSFGAGTTLYAQYWFRIPGGGGGSFLSSSLELALAP